MLEGDRRARRQGRTFVLSDGSALSALSRASHCFGLRLVMWFAVPLAGEHATLGYFRTYPVGHRLPHAIDDSFTCKTRTFRTIAEPCGCTAWTKPWPEMVRWCPRPSTVANEATTGGADATRTSECRERRAVVSVHMAGRRPWAGSMADRPRPSH